MRDASGNLIEVQVREPWALHLLTADGTNAAAEDAETMKAAPVDGLIDHAMAILATTEMKADELADFVTTVAKASGIGVQAVKARIAKERRKREEAERKAAFATGGDGRLIRSGRRDVARTSDRCTWSSTGDARIAWQHQFRLISFGHRNAVRGQRGCSPLHFGERRERYRTLSARSTRPLLAAWVRVAALSALASSTRCRSYSLSLGTTMSVSISSPSKTSGVRFVMS